MWISIHSEKKRPQELRGTLGELLKQNPKGIVIDLRNNPGGYLNTAVEVSSEFIEKGVVMYEQYGDGTRDEYKALGNGRATDIPIVVLINEGSPRLRKSWPARCRIMDVPSWSACNPTEKAPCRTGSRFPTTRALARVTIARWLTPKERTIDHIGLTPDVIVEMTAEDFTAGRDPQLDAAERNNAWPCSTETPFRPPAYRHSCSDAHASSLVLFERK